MPRRPAVPATSRRPPHPDRPRSGPVAGGPSSRGCPCGRRHVDEVVERPQHLASDGEQLLTGVRTLVPPGPRSNSTTPRDRSSWWIWAVSVGWLTNSRAAARRKFSSSASATKARTCSTRIARPPLAPDGPRGAGDPPRISSCGAVSARRTEGCRPASSQVVPAGRGPVGSVATRLRRDGGCRDAAPPVERGAGYGVGTRTTSSDPVSGGRPSPGSSVYSATKTPLRFALGSWPPAVVWIVPVQPNAVVSGWPCVS